MKTEVPMKQSIWNPRNWTILCYINLGLAILLFIDWVCGLGGSIVPRFSFLASTFPGIPFFHLPLSLIIVLLIALLSLGLNEKLNSAPLFTAVAILGLAFLGVNQYTLLGRIGDTLLGIECSVVLVLFAINLTLYENQKPITNLHALFLGVILLSASLLLNSFIFGWRIDEIWGIFYVGLVLGGILLVRFGKVLLGAFPILLSTVANDYFLSYHITGFEAGEELLKFLALFLIVYSFLRK